MFGAAVPLPILSPSEVTFCPLQVSEENDDPIIIEEPYRGQYCVVMDPLDGSSNIDCGVSIGTIFGIYRVQPGSHGSVEDVLKVPQLTTLHVRITTPAVDQTSSNTCGIYAPCV